MTPSKRTPGSITLPYGYEARVELVDDPALFEREGAHSLWDYDNHRIFIDKRLAPAERRGCLLHEMPHVLTDWSRWVKTNLPVVEPEQVPVDPNEKEDE